MKLLNRIEKIEATLRNQSAGAVLLCEPAPDANDAAWEQFSADVSAAQDAGQKVIVRASGAPTIHRLAGVIYEPDDFSALLALLAYTPADDGRSKDRLHQLIKQVQGTSLPVVREVKP